MRQTIVMICVLVVIGWFWLFPRPIEVEYLDQGPVALEKIEVEIKGAVLFPGIYVFFNEITVSQVIEYAGGFSKDADSTTVRMSEVITRNKTITILSAKDESVSPSVLINVNTASFKELLEIPGMTEIRAASLIIYREQHGDFQTIEEVINVKNIGVVTLEKIKPYITLG